VSVRGTLRPGSRRCSRRAMPGILPGRCVAATCADTDRIQDSPWCPRLRKTKRGRWKLGYYCGEPTRRIVCVPDATGRALTLIVKCRKAPNSESEDSSLPRDIHRATKLCNIHTRSGLHTVAHYLHWKIYARALLRLQIQTTSMTHGLSAGGFCNLISKFR